MQSSTAYEHAEQGYSPLTVQGTFDRANLQQNINHDTTTFQTEKPVIANKTMQEFLRIALKRSHRHENALQWGSVLKRSQLYTGASVGKVQKLLPYILMHSD